MNPTAEQLAEHERTVSRVVSRVGYLPLGRCRFLKDGKVYDLSAADLSQLERIQREGLFVVDIE
ncbi:hypothetical protein [Burkholderia cenocepacia]|uniref:hypothetical protein n=1 Tax=Burkholderia cenocepacia TaxID=95486 RepID=UPI000B04823C|nr:hypothetical protein [Burkholderia cenocepacia]